MLKPLTLHFFAIAVFALIFLLSAHTADAPKPLEKIDKIDDLFSAFKNSRAKIVLLNVWGSNCGVCIADMPVIASVAEKMKSDPSVAFLGLCIPEDGKLEKKDLDHAAEIVQSKKADFRNFIWTGAVEGLMQRFNILGTPTVLLLNTEGKTITEIEMPEHPDQVMPLILSGIAKALSNTK